MSYGTVVMKISILFLFSSVFLGANGELYYAPKITDKVFECDDFQNDFLDCSGLQLGSMQGDEGEDAAKLNGEIKTKMEIDSGCDIQIEIWKMLDLADEFMYDTRVDFCSSLENTDAPWYPVLEKLNISSCPVPISTFEVKGLTISLDSMKDVMCHDFCGEYRIQLSFMDKTDQLSCHNLEICIVECDDENDNK